MAGITWYETDPAIFLERWERMGGFTVDSAASDANALVRPHPATCGVVACYGGGSVRVAEPGECCVGCGTFVGRYYTVETNGLDRSHYLPGDRVWSNPPYNHLIRHFLKLASETRPQGVAWDFLLPSNTAATWFHKYVWDKRFKRPREGVELDFPEGRIAFLLDGKPILDKKTGEVQAPRHEPMWVTFWPEGMGPR